MQSSNPSARRILFVEGNIDGTIGGSYFSLLFLASGLDRRRFEPIVVFAADNPLRARFDEQQIRTVIQPPPQPVLSERWRGSLVSRAVNFVHGWLIEPMRLARLLKQERIALVHLNNSITRNHPWMIAARLAGVPCITHERGINTEFKPRDRWLGRRLDAVICISAAVRENFVARHLGSLPLSIIHNGLDPRQMRVTRSPGEIRAELDVPEQTRLIGIVGNIRPWKGQEVVIRALATLRDEFPDVTCLLIGDIARGEESYRAEIEHLVAQLGLAGRVLLTGFRADVANYVNALEIQIHASTAPEPFGRVLLEAMALSKPLIASGGGAVPEIVVDGTTGLLFEPGNPDALGRCLRKLLQDRKLAAQLGSQGRRRLEDEFSIDHNIELTQHLYTRVLST